MGGAEARCRRSGSSRKPLVEFQCWRNGPEAGPLQEDRPSGLPENVLQGSTRRCPHTQMPGTEGAAFLTVHWGR